MSTLYEKIGGAAAIERLVDEFYDRVLADPVLAPFFANTPMERQRRMQKIFMTLALGGPEPDEPIDLYQAHRGRGIKRDHLTRFTELLLQTLESIGISNEDANKVIARIATYSDEVLGETSVDG